MFLHTILGRDKDELTRRVLEAQINNPTKGDFIELVEKDMGMIGEPLDKEGLSSQNKN